MKALHRIPTVLALAVVLLLGASVAYAAIPGSNDTFTGCVNDRTGVLRMIDPAKGQKCVERPQALRETAITWNQRGPAGSVGPVGPAAPAAPASGGLTSLDQLAGLPCDVNSPKPGVTVIRYFNGPVSLYCQKAGEPDVLQPQSTVTASAGQPTE